MKTVFGISRMYFPASLLCISFTAISCVAPVSGGTGRFGGYAPPPPVSQTFQLRDIPATDKHSGIAEPEAGTLRLTVSDAVVMALSNNRALEVERLSPSIRATFEEQESAMFDPVMEGSISTERSKERRLSTTGVPTGDRTVDRHRGGISLKQFFPSGTHLEAGLTAERTNSDSFPDPFSSSRLGLTMTQSLLRGYGSGVNLARLRQSRLDTEISGYELRGFGEFLVAEVEHAYWDYALALRRMEIVMESLRLAEHQMEETIAMIHVGTMAEAELAAVQAEVAIQKQGIINARSAKERSRLRLLQLINLQGSDQWSREIEPIHPPELPEGTIEEITDHLAMALAMRPEMSQARLIFERGEIEIVRTRNGLLPLMNLFVTLGKTGYAQSFTRSMDNIPSDGYDVGVGISMQYPFFNRDAGARHRRAGLELEQSRRAIENLAQLIEMDVRKAHIEVSRTREQIAAGTATREFQEEKLRSETEKFRVGRSTNFLVAQAQRDLLVSRINEVEAVVDYLKALVDFYRLEGSLLERRGIEAPGT